MILSNHTAGQDVGHRVMLGPKEAETGTVAGHAGQGVVSSSIGEAASDLVAARAVRPDLSIAVMPILGPLNRAVPMLSAHRRGR